VLYGFQIMLSKFPLIIVILSKRSLRREGSGRAARCVAFFVTQQSRVWFASLSKPDTLSCVSLLIRDPGPLPYNSG
jgi:hypothetical protein